jgi:hypothetical protein
MLLGNGTVTLPRRRIHTQQLKDSKVKVTLQLTISLGVRRPSGTRDPRPIFLSPWDFLLENYCLLSSLTRGRIGNLLLLLVLASAVTLGSSLSDERPGMSIISHYLLKIFTIYVFDTVQECIYNIYKASFSPGSVQQIMPKLLVAYTTMTV